MKQAAMNIANDTKHLIDATSIGVTIAALAQYLPWFASSVSIVWFIFRIRQTIVETKLKKVELKIKQKELAKQ